MILIALLLSLGTSYRHSHNHDPVSDSNELYELAYNHLTDLSHETEEELMEKLLDIENSISSNVEIPPGKLKELVQFLELRNEKKRVKKLFKKMLKDKGLSKLTGKKISQLQRSSKTCKSKCTKAQKMAKRAIQAPPQ